jgi:hypothetical protein
MAFEKFFWSDRYAGCRFSKLSDLRSDDTLEGAVRAARFTVEDRLESGVGKYVVFGYDPDAWSKTGNVENIYPVLRCGEYSKDTGWTETDGSDFRMDY